MAQPVDQLSQGGRKKRRGVGLTPKSGFAGDSAEQNVWSNYGQIQRAPPTLKWMGTNGNAAKPKTWGGGCLHHHVGCGAQRSREPCAGWTECSFPPQPQDSDFKFQIVFLSLLMTPAKAPDRPISRLWRPSSSRSPRRNHTPKHTTEDAARKKSMQHGPPPKESLATRIPKFESPERWTLGNTTCEAQLAVNVAAKKRRGRLASDLGGCSCPQLAAFVRENGRKPTKRTRASG